MVISFYPNFGWGFLLSDSQKKNIHLTKLDQDQKDQDQKLGTRQKVWII